MQAVRGALQDQRRADIVAIAEIGQPQPLERAEFSRRVSMSAIAWVGWIFVGEPVDDRHRRVGAQFDDVIVTDDPGQDAHRNSG